MSTLDSRPAPGSCFKFTVRSADEAVALIRERLGANARVLSVRSVEATGFRKFFSSPRIEVIAQMDGAAEPVSAPANPVPESAPLADVSSEPALPGFLTDSA